MTRCLRCLLLVLWVVPAVAQATAQGDGKENGGPPSSAQETLTASRQKPRPTAAGVENNDLDRLPDTQQQPAAPDPDHPAASGANQRIYIENASTLSARRGGLIVPAPQPAASTWQERLFLDMRKRWNLGDHLSLTLSDRFNLRAENDIPFASHENVINDLREVFLSWEPRDRTYLDFGRINLKSGAALGFNPTDFFKTRAVVEPLSADPSVLREDRLGTLMVRAQHIFGRGAILAVFAPAVSRQSAIYSNTNLPSFNPSFERTNARDRLLLKGSANIGNNFSPELLLYREGNVTKLGANITRSFGQRVVGYAEWAGGKQPSLIDRARSYGRDTGTLPLDGSSALPQNPGAHFTNDLSAGASYATSVKVTFNLEYHFHQAGFSRHNLSDWFSNGQGTTSSSPVARELWYIRGYALDQQEPLTRHSLFLRADWVDAFVPHLEITGFINTDLYDGSDLAQIAAEYHLSNAWTIGLQASANLGSKRSDFGSLPQAASALLKVTRYFGGPSGKPRESVARTESGPESRAQ
jgi:hypothetical protein